MSGVILTELRTMLSVEISTPNVITELYSKSWPIERYVCNGLYCAG